MNVPFLFFSVTLYVFTPTHKNTKSISDSFFLLRIAVLPIFNTRVLMSFLKRLLIETFLPISALSTYNHKPLIHYSYSFLKVLSQILKTPTSLLTECELALMRSFLSLPVAGDHRFNIFYLESSLCTIFFDYISSK